MRTLLTAVSILSLCASSSLLAGCEVSDCQTEDGDDAKCAESLKQFTADEQTIDLDYVEGASVTVDGKYGDITVLRGDPGTVSTTFKPFNWRGHGQVEDAELELENNLDLSASADADGNVTVATDRHDATNGLGSHITVRLPPEFSGTLIVQNAGDGAINPGYIDVKYVAESTTLNVVNSGLGLCSVLRGWDDEASVVSNLTDVDVRCEDDIIVRGVNDNVFVKNTSPAFRSDVVVEIVSVSAAANGGTIIGENSNVQVTLPLAGDYEVMANAAGRNAEIGRVETGECEELVSDAKDLQLSCGAGGPIYEVSATDTDEDDEPVRLNLYVR